MSNELEMKIMKKVVDGQVETESKLVTIKDEVFDLDKELNSEITVNEVIAVVKEGEKLVKEAEDLVKEEVGKYFKEGIKALEECKDFDEMTNAIDFTTGIQKRVEKHINMVIDIREKNKKLGEIVLNEDPYYN